MAERTVGREVWIGILIAVVGGLIVAFLVDVFRIGAPADTTSPPSTASATESESSTPSPESTSNASATTESSPSVMESTDSPAMWLAEVEPLTDVGLWNSVTGTMRSKPYVHAWVVPTEWGDGQTSWATWALDGAYTKLTGAVGVEDGGHASEKAFFEIIFDGAPVDEFQIGVGETPHPIDLRLDGVRDLTLRVTNVSESAYAAEAVFGDFRIE